MLFLRFYLCKIDGGLTRRQRANVKDELHCAAVVSDDSPQHRPGPGAIRVEQVQKDVQLKILKRKERGGRHAAGRQTE